MSTVDPKDLAAFAEQADAWFAENVVRDPGFMLPLTFMEVGTDPQFNFLRDWQNKVWEAGYLGAAWPKAYGGGGLPQAFQTAATRAMRKHHGPIMLNAIGLNWAGPLLLEMGTEAQKAAYLKGILSAEDIWCQGFSEPGHGSDLGSAQTRAVRNGDHYVVNGSKIWTTLGRYARYMILLARTDPSTERKYDGLSFFLMPMKAPGIETVPIRKLTGEHGFTQTFFTDARAPAEGLVGPEGGGWKVAMRTLEYERGARGGQAGGYVSVGANAFDVFDLAQRTKRGGHPVLEDPQVADEMVGFLMEIQALTLNGQRTQVPELIADRPQGIPLASKLMGTEMSRRLNDFAVRLTGVRGAYYVDEPEAADNGLWARNYLNSFSATIGGGTSQIQADIVGEHVLGLPKS
ncbi:MAG: acyl-CoA dehydrogenase family protein [Phenylobacterium sp.]|uniref:acyl-CoA dehydrogenase family protein n=1 Tax=Phenylobacterium sp. TaxID=1871053 RepID=UPI0025EA26E2|nr:acyl-CoA dehydrogenase family protein [Phenylobacterium sp.]MCA3709082.1 acyl-CoA dehydrogenase family protein [Phenylobacterium sp.]